MAMMYFHFARVAGRIDSQGVYLPLAQQDRAVWDLSLIERGLSHMSRSARGPELSALHLEAAIACQHCLCRRKHFAERWFILPIRFPTPASAQP